MSTNRLVVDYSGEWAYIDGVEDVGFAFGPDRKHTAATAPTPPTTGVKVFRCNPTHKEVVVAAGTVGYEATDMVFVIWAETLVDTASILDPKARVVPKDGDILQPTGEEWIIKSVKRTIDYAQFRCLCMRSTKTE